MFPLWERFGVAIHSEPKQLERSESKPEQSFGATIGGWMTCKVAILIDGGFLKSRLKEVHRKFPTGSDIVKYCDNVMKSEQLKNDELFRIYYYDCWPYHGQVTNPVDGQLMDCSSTAAALNGEQFLKELSLKPKVAFRKGELSYEGWRIESQKIRKVLDKINRGGRIEPDDFKIDLKQKRVDIKIGLDIAWLSSKRIVDKIVLVTSDTDFIPAIKFARREGLIVFLCPMRQTVNQDLVIHSDDVINV
ncbi:MAG: hypothetical protein A2219_08010 [Elusimicrobia bacterium RIFOXYA2_FULL_50_26]|nr:MAG: hypothetical protein A2219_08010 [Elusimicrobia bacterium RIFOXYA2_FULL_50_26]